VKPTSFPISAAGSVALVVPARADLRVEVPLAEGDDEGFSAKLTLGLLYAAA
jgi:hypothetical protein